MAETIKAVKGFNQDMTCTPTKDVKFQYEEGKTYEEEVADVCNQGFHACELPINAFSYYPPTKSIYHEVEMFGKIDSSESNKTCSSKIKIGAKINIAGIIKASIDIIRRKAEEESSASSGYRGNAASSGDYGNAASSGNCGNAASSGYSGSAKAEHPNSCAIAWGPESKANGVKGSHLVLAEWESNGGNYWDEETWTFKGAKMVVVDGENIKENTWYGLKNGKVIEIKED
jgi:hypothetical protein